MKGPEPAQFGNKMVHDVSSGCFGIFRSEPLVVSLDSANNSALFLPHEILPCLFRSHTDYSSEPVPILKDADKSTGGASILAVAGNRH